MTLYAPSYAAPLPSIPYKFIHSPASTAGAVVLRVTVRILLALIMLWTEKPYKSVPSELHSFLYTIPPALLVVLEDPIII
jgi:hypothetical protein